MKKNKEKKNYVGLNGNALTVEVNEGVYDEEPSFSAHFEMDLDLEDILFPRRIVRSHSATEKRSHGGRMRTTEFDHLSFMKDPGRWPNLILPLRRRRADGKMADTAVLFADFNIPPGFKIAFDANMFDPSSWKNLEDTTPEKLVSEGWEVD